MVLMLVNASTDIFYRFTFKSTTGVKSSQSTLSHLQSPPEKNAVPAQLWLFLVKITSSWHDYINNACPKSQKKGKDNVSIEQFAISTSSISNRGKQLRYV